MQKTTHKDHRDEWVETDELTNCTFVYFRSQMLLNKNLQADAAIQTVK